MEDLPRRSPNLLQSDAAIWLSVKFQLHARWVIAVLWLAVSLGALIALYGLSGFVFVLAGMTAVPVFAVPVCRRAIKSPLACLIDATGIVYMAWMVWGYANGYGTGDALASLVYFFYPLYALAIIVAEMVVINVIEWVVAGGHRKADD